MEETKLAKISLFIDENLKLFEHFADLLGVSLEIFSCVDHQHLTRVVLLEPIFMLSVDHLQVFQGNLLLFLSLSHFRPFVALSWLASQINDLCFVNRCHGLVTGVKRLEDFVLGLVHVPKIFHELGEDILVGKDAPL